MAENDKQETQTEEEKQKDSERLNRKINYFVIRSMWQIAHGRGGNSVYSVLGMSRERFTRVLELGNIKYRKGEVEKLATTLNVSPGILEGKSRFQFFTKADRNNEDISRVSWKTLFNLRESRVTYREKMKLAVRGSDEWEQARKQLEEKQKEYSELRDVILAKLKEYEDKGYTDRDLNQLYQFMKRGWTNKDMCLRNFETVMSSLDIHVLEQCNINELRNLKRCVAIKNELITALIVYKKHKSVKK